MQIFVNTNYDFMRWRNRAVIFSLAFMLVGLGLFLSPRGLKTGIDFSGGASLVLKFRGEVPMDRLRAQLAGASIQRYGKADDNAVLIRLPQQGREGDYAGAVVAELNKTLNPEGVTRHDLNFQGRATLAELFKNADPDGKGTGPTAHDYYDSLAQSIIEERSRLGLFHDFSEVTKVPGLSAKTAALVRDRAFLGQFNVLNQETVGPIVGKELKGKAIWAVILSSLAMGIYITIRFDLKFGVAAMLCIVHDVLIAMAFLIMVGGEFSLNIVAALLLIVGYSINDNVVTYDRVRENAKKLKTKQSFGEQLNLAMNQTLSRTILTSGSVLLVLLALYLFGGEVIHEFSMILLVGVFSGTYSTLMIVPAVAIAWDDWIGKKRGTNTPRRVEPIRNGAVVPSPKEPKRAKG